MKWVLAHPPLDDPTIPYHSTAYLAGHLVHCGFADVAIRDVNIEFVNWTFEPETFAAFNEEVTRRVHAFERRGALSFEEQEEYLGMWRQKPPSFEALERAIAGMRDREAFLSFPDYERCRGNIVRYLDLLGALSFPSELSNFRQATRGRFSLYSFRDLFDEALSTRACYVFDRFLEERLATDAEFSAADSIGISIVYDYQLLHAVHMARWAKRRWPDKQVMLGGTAISQLYKYIRDKQLLKQFFTVCDGIVVGEGETAICQITDAGGLVVPGMKVNNLVSYDRAADRLHLPEFVHYENVATLGRPLFRYPWDLYLAPDRGINYSPTRGCYWNRCTFCDYGLNTSKPTSPWRERQVGQAVEDLRAAVEETGARYVYLAVDVMSPAYLERLADAVIDAGLDIRWSAELRLEKVFSPQLCEKLVASGCVSIAFGMESGSQRILDLIDKGTKVTFMGETMKNFAEAGIAVQLMAFSDFPTETPAEKEETRRFVREHDPYWSAGGIGSFVLTGTALVAKDPARFGVRLVETEDVDVRRALAYEVEQDSRDEESKSMLTEDRDASFDSGGDVFPHLFGRPWAGGTDALHSMIYYDHYGRRFFRDQIRARAGGPIPIPDELLRSCTLSLSGVVKDSPFDLGKILAERHQLADHLTQLSRVHCEPTRRAYRQWAEGRPRLAAEPRRAHWNMAGTKCVRLDPLVRRLLASHPEPIALGELVALFDESLAARLLLYFKRLAGHGLFELRLPAELTHSDGGDGANELSAFLNIAGRDPQSAHEPVLSATESAV
jgi:radical SAM superfamily enzyme YgiQ (UPF0313 family)